MKRDVVERIPRVFSTSEANQGLIIVSVLLILLLVIVKIKVITDSNVKIAPNQIKVFLKYFIVMIFS